MLPKYSGGEIIRREKRKLLALPNHSEGPRELTTESVE